MTKRPLLSANLKASAKRQMRDARRQAPAVAVEETAAAEAKAAEQEPVIAGSFADTGAVEMEAVSVPAKDAPLVGPAAFEAEAPEQAQVAETVAAPIADEQPLAAETVPVEASLASAAAVEAEAPVAAESVAGPVAAPLDVRVVAPGQFRTARQFMAETVGARGPAATLARAMVEISVMMPAVTMCRYSTMQVRLATSMLESAFRSF